MSLTPLTRHLTLGRTKNLVKHDNDRAKALRARAQLVLNGDPIDEPAVIGEAIDNWGVIYTATVAIGNPPTNFNLEIDTGSSNTWVGAGTAFVATSTTQQTGQEVDVVYGSGRFFGNQVLDTLTIAPGLTIPAQSIGIAEQSHGFGLDGILGIGPINLTRGTLSPDHNLGIPTVTDNLFNQGSIDAHEIGISFEPTTQNSGVDGEITWGGTESSQYTGGITYTPITSTRPSSMFWGIDQSIRYGPYPILDTTAGIVDTGSTLLLLSTDAYAKYVSLTGAVEDQVTGLLKITSAQYAKLESMFFQIGDTSFEFTANAQLWPRFLNTTIGGDAHSLYLIVSTLDTHSGHGLDFTNGYTWMQRFYSVFDTANQRVGIATTPHTYAMTN